MKKFFLTLAGVAVLAGSMAVAPAPAEAKHWQGHGHRQHCRIVVKKKVVWRQRPQAGHPPQGTALLVHW